MSFLAETIANDAMRARYNYVRDIDLNTNFGYQLELKLSRMFSQVIVAEITIVITECARMSVTDLHTTTGKLTCHACVIALIPRDVVEMQNAQGISTIDGKGS